MCANFGPGKLHYSWVKLIQIQQYDWSVGGVKNDKIFMAISLGTFTKGVCSSRNRSKLVLLQDSKSVYNPTYLSEGTNSFYPEALWWVMWNQALALYRQMSQLSFKCKGDTTNDFTSIPNPKKYFFVCLFLSMEGKPDVLDLLMVAFVIYC